MDMFYKCFSLCNLVYLHLYCKIACNILQNGFGTTSDEDESFGDIPEVNLDGEGRDSPGMGARESGYSSTCADSLGHLNTDSENDIRSQSPDEGSLVRKSTTVKDALLVMEIIY